MTICMPGLALPYQGLALPQRRLARPNGLRRLRKRLPHEIGFLHDGRLEADGLALPEIARGVDEPDIRLADQATGKICRKKRSRERERDQQHQNALGSPDRLFQKGAVGPNKNGPATQFRGMVGGQRRVPFQIDSLEQTGPAGELPEDFRRDGSSEKLLMTMGSGDDQAVCVNDCPTPFLRPIGLLHHVKHRICSRNIGQHIAQLLTNLYRNANRK
jgi:hypothetical protein